MRRYTRRDFLRTIAGGAALSLSTMGRISAGASEGGVKPNVLFIAVDDLRPQLGCFGYSHMVTPNIDRLAREGRLFRRHYVQSAVCGPSRCTLLTGKIQNSWDCWGPLREQKVEPAAPVSFAHLFRRNGYRTVCIGKISHQPGGVMDKEQKIHQVPFSWDIACAPVGQWRTPWRAFFSYDKAKAYNKVIRMEKDEPRLPYESADVGDTGYADGLNAEEAVRQLGQLSQQNQPFLLAVGFYKPHLPFNAPKKYWDLYEAQKIELADNPGPPANVDANISIHNSYEVTTHYHWPAGAGNISRRQARTLRRGYFACVSYVDAQIGKVLDELKRLKLDRSTIVVLWSDHGWHLGEHGMFGKQTNYDIATRSPLIIKTPGMTDPGRPADGLAETLDIYPTLARLCSLPAPPSLQGTSLAAMLGDPGHPGKPFARSFHPRGKLRGRTLKTDRYRIIHWTDRDGKSIQTELYDHRSDPHENTNIAAQYPEIVAKLLRQLKEAFEN